MAILRFIRLLLAVIALVRCLAADEPSMTEYQVKALYLYNFAKFVQWPPERFAEPNAPLVIGIVGEDPFGDELDKVLCGKTVEGQPLKARSFKSTQDFRGCHIVFVTSTERRRLAQILEPLKGNQVLTVGESDRFNEAGGIINFYMDDNKVRFEISQAAVEKSRLTISSKMLSLGIRKSASK